MFLIHLESNSIVQKLECKNNGFARHPFHITSIEDITYTNNKYLIDVVGCVFYLGVCKLTRNGSQLIEFQLTNERGRTIKASLWGPIAVELSAKVNQTVEAYVLLLPAMNVRKFKGALHLSSTSGTQIYDTSDITEIATLQQQMRYRLRLELSDDTTTLVVTLFNDIVESMVNKTTFVVAAEIQENTNDDAEFPNEVKQLVGATFGFELKSHTYYNHSHYESFTASRVVTPKPPQPEPPTSLASDTQPLQNALPNQNAALTQNVAERLTATEETGASSHNPLKRKMDEPTNEGN